MRKVVLLGLMVALVAAPGCDHDNGGRVGTDGGDVASDGGGGDGGGDTDGNGSSGSDLGGGSSDGNGGSASDLGGGGGGGCVTGAVCDDGDDCTVDDTCEAGVCVGIAKVCNAAPSAVCISGTELRTYDSVGACQSGACIYTKHTVPCADGCSGDTCLGGDSCTGVTCTSPPGACYVATGTCVGAGSCEYDFDNGKDCSDNNKCTDNDGCTEGVCKGTPRVCNTPPASTCEDASTVKIWDTLGTCGPSTGACTYGYGFLTCAKGCSGGQCIPSGWAKMTSNVSKELHAVWGSSASSVWAVGEAGTIVYWNGTQWQAKSTPQEALAGPLFDVQGTAANDVFAVGADGVLLRYDGTKWKYVDTLKIGQFSSYNACLFANGPNDVYVWGRATDTAYVSRLYRVTNGTKTLIKQFDDIVMGYERCDLHVFSPTDILLTTTNAAYRWNGTTATRVGGNSDAAQQLFVESAASFAVATSNSINRWGGSAFEVFSAGGLNVVGMHGTAMNRLFLAGSRFHAEDSKDYGEIIRFDGGGITSEPLPGKLPRLNAVWAAPTGEVFAVGESGTIVKGP